MEHKIKMIGLDLDGTVLTEKKELTVRTREAISRALAQGVVVLVATGRPWMGVPEELRHFPGMHYALTSNGARIIDTQTDQVIEEHLLGPDLAQKVLEICGKYDTLQEVYFDGQGYAPADKMNCVEKYHKNPSMCEYMRKTRIPVDDISELVKKENRGLDKVQALFADMNERRAAWKELEAEDGLELVGSLRYNIEINAADANGVYIPVQNTGLNWGDGNFYVYSMAAYYLDNGASLDETKAKGVCGTLKDGVITFPSKSLLFAFFESDASLYQTGDGFKLVLPGYYEDESEAESAGTKALANARLNKGKMTVAEANVLPLPVKATLLK